MERKEKILKKLENMSLDEQTNHVKIERELIFDYFLLNEVEKQVVFDIFSDTADKYETNAYIGAWAKDITRMILDEFGIEPESLYCEDDPEEDTDDPILARITVTLKEKTSIRSITKLLEEHPDYVPSIRYDDTKINVQIGFNYFLYDI